MYLSLIHISFMVGGGVLLVAGAAAGFFIRIRRTSPRLGFPEETVDLDVDGNTEMATLAS